MPGWLGRGVPTEFLQQAFGWPSLDGVDASALRLLPPESTPLAGYLNGVCDLLRAPRAGGWLRLQVVKQGEGDAMMQRALIEDQTRHDVSYVDFLCSVHRQIQAKLTA